MAVTITMVGAGDVFVGVTGVTVANGALLLGTKGSSITIPTQGAVFGIGAVAQAVSVLETF
jgi:voltage-gated potassium channel Kch